MKLKITNILLATHVNFINSLTFDKAQTNIARVRIRKLMVNKFNEYQDDRMELIKQFANIDDFGNPVLLEDGKTFDIPEEKQTESVNTIGALDNALAVIDLTEYTDQICNLKTALENYNRDLTGDQAQLLVAFLDGISEIDKEGNLE